MAHTIQLGYIKLFDLNCFELFANKLQALESSFQIRIWNLGSWNFHNLWITWKGLFKKIDFSRSQGESHTCLKFTLQYDG